MKDDSGNYYSFYHNKLEQDYNLKLGVGDKYLANRILKNISLITNEPPMFYTVLRLYFIPMYSDNSYLFSSIKKKHEYKEQNELAIWTSISSSE